MINPIDFVIEQEGGFINDPKDPGGATKYGISLRFLKTVDPALADLDQDGDIDINDIFGMTEKQARYFYMRFFYSPLELFEYPEAIGAVLLDTAVNMGKVRAVKILQRALNKCRQNLIVDGIAGPKTRRAVQSVSVGYLMRAFLLERAFKYAHLCRRYPELVRFLNGWLNRVQALERFAGPLAKAAL